ncbi:TlpA family protein disulfide reductase [Pedobacter insulae]|nr:TlpA disulfide reductase family protein [Pedobacter insulae]
MKAKLILFIYFFVSINLGTGSQIKAQVKNKQTSVFNDQKAKKQNTAIIYGEINSPDSLGPIQLVITPYYIDPNSSFLRVEKTIDPVPGEWFDGVTNPKVKKFSTEIPLSDVVGYFSLKIKEHPVLDNYLVLPGDSLKISINMSLLDVLFEGKNSSFYEAQYAVNREQQRQRFVSPRMVVTSKSAKMFSRPESIAKMAEFKDKFGFRLTVLEPGKEILDYHLSYLEHPERVVNSQLEIIDSFSEHLSSEQCDLLKAKILCDFYGAGLSTYRNFHHETVEGQFNANDQVLYRNRVQRIIRDIAEKDFLLNTQLVSASFLDMALESCILTAIWENKSFLEIVKREYREEVADRLRASYLSNHLQRLPNKENYIHKFLAATKTSPWKDRIQSLERSNIVGEVIQQVNMVGLDGMNYTKKNILGKPTLLYFYFSSCHFSKTYFQQYLFPLYQETKDLGYQLIAVSIDKDQTLWKSRIDEYSNSSILSLNLRDKDKEFWISYYEIFGYPKTMFLDEHGKIISFDIGSQANNYETFRSNFLELYNKEIKNLPSPTGTKR